MDQDTQSKILEGIEKVETEMQRTGMDGYVASLLVLNKWDYSMEARGVVIGMTSVVCDGHPFDDVVEGVLAKFDHGEEDEEGISPPEH